MDVSQASPAPLHAQAFGKIAAEQMLPHVHKLAVEVDPNLAAHVAPPAAERVVLGQVAARIRIDHAVEEAPVKMRLRIVGRTVRNVLELRIALHHRQEDVALDDHVGGSATCSVSYRP